MSRMGRGHKAVPDDQVPNTAAELVDETAVPTNPNQLSRELLDWAIHSVVAVLNTAQAQESPRARERLSEALKALDALFPKVVDL